ncbi:MAG: D-Ala-D-Ala carboxypeptidase family metallohydrolase [Pseudomonadota bacterium]
MKKISDHITYAEATKSSVAIRHGLENKPNADELKKMKLVAEKLFEPMRKGLGGHAIYLSSFFRADLVNKKAGGSSTSGHRKGDSIDADADVYNIPGLTNLDIFNFIKDNLEFDQLIWEYENPDGSPAWVHMSFREGNNRNQVMKAIRVKGKTKYIFI